MWEKLNEKVILEYKIENETKFKELFVDFLKNNTEFHKEGLQEKTVKIDIENNLIMIKGGIPGARRSLVTIEKVNK